ncbi:FAD-binding oxidoreductase [Bailinhaonella thermotolerans]|uniref:FAD-binding oxidoreductase n=1 Tax=Bailinhaonella thermotolerans TaxID=1070861 RepID=A0A3A4AMR2_9ACTN|nr:FAD-dependent oxidoreductase [Bailinhaonella thermotolerans]RJL20391.1 FAD-binding oxidoreductase [Bailinhaonella thermotolerans]
MSELRNRIAGRVRLAGDEGFEDARRPWNLAVEQPVHAVVEAATADDVAEVVRYARDTGLAVAPQASGHGASGDVEGVILLRTGRLDDVRVDPGARTARVGAGVRWARLLEAVSPYGLTGVAGSSGAVTVAGYTLGGGLGWFSRRYGFAARSVRAFEVVDADGERGRVTADSDPGLFWALRGGGGEFALVTAIELDLHPAPALYGGRVLWPADKAPEVLAAFREITATAPEELTVWFDLLRFPGAPPTVAVDATYLGDAAEARELLRPLDRIGGAISDGRAELPVAALPSITAEPTDPGAGLSRAELLTGLDDVAGVLLDGPLDPLLSVQLRHLGGALARPSGTAAGHLAEPYLLYMFGLALDPALAAAVDARQGEIAGRLAASATGRKPYTFLRPGERAELAFAADDLARLRELKRRHDPRDLFRANYPVSR